MQNLKQILKAIGIGSLIVMGGVLLIKALMDGTAATERSECLQWAMEAQQRPGFYLTDWQDQQCRHYDIIINTFIK